MLKYLFIAFVIIGCAGKSKAQLTNDNARDEFIEMVNNFAKSAKYVQKMP